MRRPLLSLTLAFALILAAAAALLFFSHRQASQIANQTSEPSGAVPLSEESPDTASASGETPAGSEQAGGSQAPAGEQVSSRGDTGGSDGQAQDGNSSAPVGAVDAPSSVDGTTGESTIRGEQPAGSESTPSFDVVRVEPNGDALIAGRAPPNAELEILSDGEVIARATADPDGAFLATPDAALAPGAHSLSVRKAGDSTVVGPEQLATVLVPGAPGAPDASAPREDQVASAEPGQSSGRGASQTDPQSSPGGELPPFATTGPESGSAGAPDDAAPMEGQVAATEQDGVRTGGAGAAGMEPDSPGVPGGAGAQEDQVAAVDPGSPTGDGAGEIGQETSRSDARLAGAASPEAGAGDIGESAQSDEQFASGGEGAGGVGQDTSKGNELLPGAASPGIGAGDAVELTPPAGQGAGADAAVAGGTLTAPGGGGAADGDANAPAATDQVPGTPEVAGVSGDSSQAAEAGPNGEDGSGQARMVEPRVENNAAVDPANALEPGSQPGSPAGAPSATAPDIAETAQDPTAPGQGGGLAAGTGSQPADGSRPPVGGLPIGGAEVTAEPSQTPGAEAGAEPSPGADKSARNIAALGEPGATSGPSQSVEADDTGGQQAVDGVRETEPDAAGGPDGAGGGAASSAETATRDAPAGPNAAELPGAASQPPVAAVNQPDRALDHPGAALSFEQASPNPGSPDASGGSGRGADMAALEPGNTQSGAKPEGDGTGGSAPAAGEVPVKPAPDLAIMAAEAEAETFYVAGEARPGSLVRVYADEQLVGEAEANFDGKWLLEARREIAVGEVVIRAEAIQPDTASPSDQVEIPFVRYGDGIVLEPVAVTSLQSGEAFSATAGRAPTSYVIIRRGDNLWRISRRNYGRGIRYEAIFAANRDQIRNPHRIYPGQVFILPTRDRSWETAIN